MSEHLANNAITTLVNSIGIADTEIVVASISAFPDPNFRILIDNELMLVTNVVGTTFTVTRGVEETKISVHDRNVLVAQTLTVQGLTNFITELLGT